MSMMMPKNHIGTRATRRLLLSVFVVVVGHLGSTAPVQAQETVYAEEPTQGLYLPGVPLAGEHDALSVSRNPAGLSFLRAFHAGLGVDVADRDLGGEDRSTGAGPGVGLYVGMPFGNRHGPKFAFGLGMEWLRPSRIALEPDPGSPTRFTMAASLPLGRSMALGFSRHHFSDDGQVTDDATTWDLGISARLGAHFALGGAIRDLGAPTVGDVPVQRRYELELVSRPIATDRLELGLGGRIGETRTDVDGWLRVSARIARGLYVKSEFTSRDLLLIENTPSGRDERFERELVVSAGLELSFGGLGTGFFATGARSQAGDNRLASASAIVRASAEHIPSIFGRPKRIERIEIIGSLGDRALTSLVLRLRAIARDPAAVAVVVQIDDLKAGWASVHELRNELLRVRKAGKKVFAYLVAATTRDYFLASAADKIYVDPAGGIRLAGFAGTSLYFKGLFDRLGVAAQFEKIEEYKSAPESWTRESPTEPALRMRDELYDSLYESVISEMAASREVDAKKFREMVDRGPYSAGDLAKSSTLVDAVAEPDEISKLIIKEIGGAYPIAEAPRERPDRWSTPAIAVIYIDGDIVDGKSQNIPIIGRKLVGGETIARAIAAARAARDVKAIVLRIDSPGGSALASELMSREVFKTRGVKPIICSMGDVAASGGYFAAAGCEVIFAEPTTITGSIGIFYGKFDVSTLLGRLGLSWQTYKRGEHSDMESYFRSYTDDERKLLKERLRYFYGRFVGAVAKGRGMTEKEVDAIGRGRVWSGAMAKKVKLVDRLGGLADAIYYAKKRVGLGDDRRARLVMLPKPEGGLLNLVLGAIGRARSAQSNTAQSNTAQIDLRWLPGGNAVLQAVPASLWARPDVPQARLPFSIIWH